MLNITIVCIEITTPGNLGAIARAMANFGLKNLVLVSPLCEPNAKEASDRAKHAKSILKNAQVKDYEYYDKYLLNFSNRLNNPFTHYSISFMLTF